MRACVRAFLHTCVQRRVSKRVIFQNADAGARRGSRRRCHALCGNGQNDAYSRSEKTQHTWQAVGTGVGVEVRVGRQESGGFWLEWMGEARDHPVTLTCIIVTL